MTKKIIPKGEALRTTMDTKDGRPVITFNGDNVIIEQVEYPPEDKRHRGDKTIDKMYPMEVLLQMPRTKKEAVEKGETKYFTNKPCKHGHLTYRQVTSGLCARCASIKGIAYVKNRRKSGDFLPWEKMGKEVKQILSTVPATIRNSNERTVTDRIEAARKGLMFYYDPSPCENGHEDKQRYVSNNACVVCSRKAQQEHRDRQRQKTVIVDNENVMSKPTIIIEDK